MGVHRWFGFRHLTQLNVVASFTSVEVMPELDDTIEVEIRDDDEMDTFRSGGPWGQNVNKVSTGVRLVYSYGNCGGAVYGWPDSVWKP